MALANKLFVSFLPSVANSGSLTIGDGRRMDGIRVLMIENKDVSTAATGRCRKSSCLVGA